MAKSTGVPEFVANALTMPAVFYATATPSDTVNENFYFSRIYVGGPGNLGVARIQDGTVVMFIGVPAGTVLPVAGLRIQNSNLTASSIVLFQ